MNGFVRCQSLGAGRKEGAKKAAKPGGHAAEKVMADRTCRAKGEDGGWTLLKDVLG